MPFVRESMSAGGVIEIREYYSAKIDRGKVKREARSKESPLAMQIVNHRNSERKLRGLLRANFADQGYRSEAEGVKVPLFAESQKTRGQKRNYEAAFDP